MSSHMSSNFFTAVRCCEQDMLSYQDTESKAAQATATGSRPWWLHPTIQPKLPRSSSESRLLFLDCEGFLREPGKLPQIESAEFCLSQCRGPCLELDID